MNSLNKTLQALYRGRREWWFWVVMASWLIVLPFALTSAERLWDEVANSPLAKLKTSVVEEALAQEDIAMVARSGNSLFGGPNLTVTAEGGALQIAAKNIEGYSAVMYATTQISGLNEGSVWKIAQLCMGEVCANGAVVVRLNGYRLKFSAGL